MISLVLYKSLLEKIIFNSIEAKVTLKNMSIINQPLIGAVVVLFFPDIELVKRLLNGLTSEVQKVYIIDNTLDESLDCLSQDWFLAHGYDVVYRSLGDNYGIAKAQNVGIELAIKNGCDHIVFFDQDSAISKGVINTLLLTERAFLSQSVNVASVGPTFIDEKTGHYCNVFKRDRFFSRKVKVTPEHKEPIHADFLISSGSLMRVEVLKKVGLMREDLFIDWVDLEWGLRANRLGFVHFMVPAAIMFHRVGDRFLQFGKYRFNVHNDIRKYYIVRNTAHLLIDSNIETRWRLRFFLLSPFFVVFYSLTSASKLKSFKRLLCAFYHGFTGRLGKCS